MTDYVIIGAGSAGCVLANRLSADPHNRVLLLEAGKPDTKLEIHIPAAWVKTLKTEVDWQYYTERQPGLHDRRLFWPRGKTLGGSSAINAMIYIRGNAYDYNHWAELGNTGWAYRDVLPYFVRMEHQERGNIPYHGTGGLLNVADLRAPNPMSEAFVRAASENGVSSTDDFNGAQQEGVGLFQVTQKDGKRHSAATAYLKPVLDRPNLTIKTGAQVLNIGFEGTRARRVVYRHEGQVHTATVEREIVLCGGAVNSPQLLMLSGIGEAEHLKSLNIEVVSDVPGVGQNLQDHLIAGVIHYGIKPVSLANATKPQNILHYLLTRSGMLTSNLAEAGAFRTVDPDAPAPDVQYHFGPAHFVDHGKTELQGHGFALGGLVLRPKSRGEIRLRNTNPLTHPLIEPRYLSDPEGDDLRLTLEALKWAREVFRSEHFDPFRGLELLPGGNVQTDDDLIYYIRAKAETLYHPVGTCKMGADNDPLAVVDAGLKVRGVQGLRVVDASIMPTITSGNTNAPTMMIAEKAADMILEGV